MHNVMLCSGKGIQSVKIGYEVIHVSTGFDGGFK